MSRKSLQKTSKSLKTHNFESSSDAEGSINETSNDGQNLQTSSQNVPSTSQPVQLIGIPILLTSPRQLNLFSNADELFQQDRKHSQAAIKKPQMIKAINRESITQDNARKSFAANKNESNSSSSSDLLSLAKTENTKDIRSKRPVPAIRSKMPQHSIPIAQKQSNPFPTSAQSAASPTANSSQEQNPAHKSYPSLATQSHDTHISYSSTSQTASAQNLPLKRDRRVVVNFRWSPHLHFDKAYTISSSDGGGGGSDVEGDGGENSPATVVQSAADDQEAAKSVASSSRHSKSFSSNKSVAGSNGTTSAQLPIKPLPNIR